MQVTGTRILRNFEKKRPESGKAIATWKQNIGTGRFGNFAELRKTFGSVDVVGPWMIFDIRGNRYRLITTIDLNRQRCHVEAALTHAQYDRRDWMKHLTTKEPSFLGWGPFEHPATVRPLYDEDDYDAALAVITQLAKWGAAESTHPQNSLLGLIFNVVHAYEQVHHPFPAP